MIGVVADLLGPMMPGRPSPTLSDSASASAAAQPYHDDLQPPTYNIVAHANATSYDFNKFINTHFTSSPSLSPKSTPTKPAKMASPRVSFIPPQLDVLAATTTQAARDSPIRLAWRDVVTFFSMIRFLLTIFLPFPTRDPTDEFYLGMPNVWGLLLMGFVTILQTVLVVIAIPAFLILPGLGIIIALAVGVGLIHALCWPLQGPPVVYSRMDEDLRKKAEKWKDERWIFINGCMVGHYGLQMSCDRFAKTFGRPVTGIHNRTYGLAGDLIECVIQRSFSFMGEDTRFALDYVKACLADPTVKTVVLLGHSQGGIIISLILDRLFSDLPAENMAKLEIYTFGNAAAHFNNPLSTIAQPASPLGIPKPTRIIPHIEHYANSEDMVTRWGVLYNVRNVLENRFSGQVFVRMKASGHMLNQHYLSEIFPLPEDLRAAAAAGRAEAELNFLDQVVDVDVKTARKRETVAHDHLVLLRRQSSGLHNLEFGNQQKLALSTVERMEGKKNLINFVGTTEFQEVESEEHMHGAHGKSVKQLSRLWRYMGGADPDTVLVNGSEIDRSEGGGRLINGNGIIDTPKMRVKLVNGTRGRE